MKIRIALLIVLGAAVSARAQQRLTLKQAEAIAVQAHPQVRAALLTALAANQVAIENKSVYYPTLFGSITGAGAMNDSRLAAGNLNNPVIYNRMASGFTLSQVITDFGRTSNLVESSRLHVQAQEDTAQATRAQILLQVDRAFYAALRTQKLLEVAQETVKARQLVADQVTALANSKLKSGLDVSFANVNLSEAKLLLVSAQNDVNAALADLSNALGYREVQSFTLEDEPATPAIPPDAPELVREALQQRPELAGERAEQSAALRFARAERALEFPTISTLAGVGAIPGHEDTLRGRYGALGININIPIFNGHLFAARRAEADLRAQAVEQNVRDLENRIARDVQVAWLNANTAYQRMGLTAELLDQANQALDLAQTRYDLGLSSIVELSQAQLNQTSAQIATASAHYDYLLQRAVLDYQTGAMK